MRYVPASAARQWLAAVLDAAQRGPVTIQRRNRDFAVVLSAREYRRLQALVAVKLRRRADRAAVRAKARGMTGKKLRKTIASGS